MSFTGSSRIAGPFTGDGATVLFAFSFKVFTAADVLAKLKDINGDESTLTLTTHYSVAVNADQNVSPGGTITMVTAPIAASGGDPAEFLTLSSQVAETQPLVIRNQSAYYPRNIEDALDRGMIVSQQLANKITRSLTFPLSDGVSLTSQLPTAGNRALKALVFDASGNAAVSVDDYTDQAANAAASAAAAAADLLLTNADVVSTGNDVTSTGNDVTSTNADVIAAAASAAAAASSAAEGLYNDVVTKTFSDSPIVPVVSEEGTLFKVDTSGGNVVINLSALSVYAEDMKFAFVKETGDANTVTVNRGGTDTIQGGTSVVLAEQYEINVLIGDSATGVWFNSIQAASIADGAVTLAKMAGGTSGDIYYIDGSGDPQLLAKGTDGEVLKLASGLPSWAADLGGSLELISTATASTSSSIDFTSGITDAYSEFIIVGREISMSTALYLRMSTDTGSTFITTNYDTLGTDYSSAITLTRELAVGHINLSPRTPLTNASSALASTEVHLYGLAAAGKATATYVTMNARNGNPFHYMGGGFNDTTTAVDAIQLLPSSGTITSGEFYLYGLKNT